MIRLPQIFAIHASLKNVTMDDPFDKEAYYGDRRNRVALEYRSSSTLWRIQSEQAQERPESYEQNEAVSAMMRTLQAI